MNILPIIRQSLTKLHPTFEEKKMMGGLCFMVNGKMCIGVINDKMMARVGPEFYEEALTHKGVTIMDFTKRPMRGFIYVLPEILEDAEQRNYWIRKALEYNPKAKSSKKE